MSSVSVPPRRLALRFKLGLALGVVEQFAVADDRDRAILVEDGLLTIVQSDNAETAMGNADARREQGAGIIGTAMG